MNKQIWLAGLIGCAAVAAGAADIAMIGTDGLNTTSFNTGNKWADGQPPVAGNTYRTAGNSLRTPPDAAGTTNVYLFAGNRLTLDGGGIGWKSFGAVIIDDLVCDGGSLSASSDFCFGRLYGGLKINTGKLLTISASENNPRGFNIYSTISGMGNIQLQMNQVTSLKQTFFYGTNTGFTGKIQLRGKGKFGVTAEEGLGGNPASFAANQLEFNGTTLIATNSLTLNDSRRGLLLNNTLNAGSQIYPGGVFEVTGSSTATVACVISGAGPLTKRGSGTLVLATNDTYTGVTTVEAGTLLLPAGASLASQTLVVTGATAVVSGEGTLGNVILSAGGRLAAGKGGWDLQSLDVRNTSEVTFAIDLSEAVSTVPLIRISGALTKSAYQVFQLVVSANAAVEVPYQVLSAPNLGDFADHDFCLSPPWIGELALTNAGSGVVLQFTPTPPGKIQFKTASDAYNTTGFTTTNWTDGLAPSGGNTYVSRSYELRTPPSGNNTFPGKRLIFDGQNVSLKGRGTATIEELTLMNNASFGMTEPVASTLDGCIRLHPVLDAGRTYSLLVNGWSNLRSLFLLSDLSGYGSIILKTVGDPSAGVALHILAGSNTNYFGRLRVEGNTNFWLRVTDESSIGGVPPAFRADQLIFNGGGLSVTNDVILDDASRGITLLADGGTASTSADAGAFPPGTPTADRRYEGGCSMRAEGAAVLTVNCPITGPGTLIKNGAGRLVLGGANSYTGLTQIIAGQLEPVSVHALGSGPVLIEADGRLLRRYPGPALPDGVELGGALTFKEGSAVRIELDAGEPMPGNFTLPLFLLAEGQSIDPATVPVEHALPNCAATVTTSLAGSHVLVSATLRFYGTLLMLR